MRESPTILRWIAVVGFGFGTATHALDFWRDGWWPYAFGTYALNAFWNMLMFLDAAVLALLIARPRAGVVAGIGLMLADVVANTHAWRLLRIDAFATAVPLQGAILLVLLVAWHRMRNTAERQH